jgi:hypothetical protein
MANKVTYGKIIRIIENRNMDGKEYEIKDLLMAFGYSATTYIKDTNLKQFITLTSSSGKKNFYRISKEMKK